MLLPHSCCATRPRVGSYLDGVADPHVHLDAGRLAVVVHLNLLDETVADLLHGL